MYKWAFSAIITIYDTHCEFYEWATMGCAALFVCLCNTVRERESERVAVSIITRKQIIKLLYKIDIQCYYAILAIPKIIVWVLQTWIMSDGNFGPSGTVRDERENRRQ